MQDKINNFCFKAIATGDGECFCFKVPKEEYKKIFGIEHYNDELRTIKQMNDQIRNEYSESEISLLQLIENEDPDYFILYPNKLFKTFAHDNLIEINLTIKEL